MNNPFSDPTNPTTSNSAQQPAQQRASMSDSENPKISVNDIFAINSAVNSGGQAYNAAPQTPAPAVYQPSGRIDATTLPLLLLGIPLAALGIGYAYYWIYQFGNMALFSQMGFGFALGCALWPMIKFGKCRNKWLAGSVALVTALLGYAVFLGFSAHADRPEYVNGYTQAISRRYKQSPQTVRPKVEQFLSPPHYFSIWMQDQAQAGVTLVDSDSRRISGQSSSSGIHFQGTGFWFYLAGQVALVAIFAILAALGAAGGRFNEEKNRWWVKKTFYQIHPSHVAAMVQSAEKGDWAMVGKLGKESKTEGNIGAQVAVYTCPPDKDAVLSIFPPGKPNNPYWEGPLPAEGLALFPRVFGKSAASKA